MTKDSTQPTKHTLGPWLVLRHGHIKARGGESIGIMHAWLGKVLEQRANARLIAAAPDMLAALSAIIGPDHCSLDVQRIAMAKAAIAKAEPIKPEEAA